MSEALFLPSPTLRQRSIAGLTFSGALSLLAVAAVLVVVSLPRLRGIALAENEVDARATAQLLAGALRAGQGTGTRLPGLRELLRRPELGALRTDGELLERGQILRHHGYLFELLRLDPSLSLPSASGGLLAGARGGLQCGLAVRAWPWAHGVTGESAFLATAAGAQLVHPNDGPRWEGLAGSGAELGSLLGWRPTP